ncbi:hypothetical protein LTR91_024991 [Friedmanniomyces endolithicus]|uniref:Uncharacterized protein n=1 Tax=Friedmanniomyces endolithicus TaxID=329885 RepID=A0AAN6JZV7_9PEZI|nr:hypothetical protein LTR94_003598 [Friedmanniomyces endolithicus]KAK0812135.1 hypothetical protein LTR59_001611 [Friedmanniomyces endolithicus]KAK0916288.1 hypothetical protein LTR02_000835 [Friedmanniomyces endolithicus]KAK0951428.1 hypothetical protein LTR91_024991 [Friedmanniomyces endolithicus]
MDRGRSGVADEHKDHPAWPAMISSESTSVSDPKVELVFRSLHDGHCPQAMCMRLGTRHALRIKHRVRDLSTVSRQRRIYIAPRKIDRMVDGRHSTRRAVREGRASLVSKAEADSATLGQRSKRARTQRTRKASDAAASPKRKRDQTDNASPAKKQKKPNPVSNPKKTNKVLVAQKPAEEKVPVLQKPQAQPAQAHDADSPEQIEIEYKWIQGELNRLSKHPRTGSYQDQLTVLFASEPWVRQAAREAREEEEAYRESLEQRPPPPPLITSSEAETECGNDRWDRKDAAKSLHEPSPFAPNPGPVVQSCGTVLAISSPPGDTASSSRQVPAAPVLDALPDLTTAVSAPDASLPDPTTAVPVHAAEPPVLDADIPVPSPKAPEPDTAVPVPAPNSLDPPIAVPGHAAGPALHALTTSQDESHHPTAPPPSTTAPSPTYSAVPPDNEHSSPPAEDSLQPATATAPPEFEDPGTDIGEDFSSLFGGEGETPPIPAAAEEKPAPLALPKPVPEPAHTSEELASPVRFVGSLPGLNLDLSRFPTLNPVKGTGKIFMPKGDKRADTDTAGPRE